MLKNYQAPGVTFSVATNVFEVVLDVGRVVGTNNQVITPSLILPTPPETLL